MLSGSGLDLAHGALQRDRVSYFERGINNVSLTNEKLNPQELKLNLFLNSVHSRVLQRQPYLVWYDQQLMVDDVS